MQTIGNIMEVSQCTNSQNTLTAPSRRIDTSSSCDTPQHRMSFCKIFFFFPQRYTSCISGHFLNSHCGSRFDDQFSLIKFKVRTKSNRILGQLDPGRSGTQCSEMAEESGTKRLPSLCFPSRHFKSWKLEATFFFFFCGRTVFLSLNGT